MGKTITRLEFQKRNKSRVNLFLDDEFAFALDMMIAATLKKGQQLSTAEIEALQQQDEEQHAFNDAVNLLGYRPRSQGEMEQHLQRKGFSANAIQVAIERLLREKYLDDAAFGQFWVESRERFRPRSAHALRYELRQKGVERAVIDEVVSTIDEESAAWTAIENRLSRWQGLERQAFVHKVSSFLARRGFGYALVRQTVDRAWQTIHADPASRVFEGEEFADVDE